MQKHIYTSILLTTIFCLKCFSQATPPIIKSYGDSVGATYCNLYISFSPNDTGTIQALIQLQEGSGNNVYDSTFTFNANDSANYEMQLDSLTPCTQYQVLINLNNDRAVGLVINPLFNLKTLCTSGIVSINENSYSVIALAKSVEVRANELPENGTVEIYDLTGKLVLKTNLTQTVQQIPFNKNEGIYLLRVTGNGQPLYTNRFAIF